MKVSEKAFEQSIEALRSEERDIKRLLVRIEALQGGACLNCVRAVTQQRLRLIQESLQANRKQIYEMIYSLEHIWDIYQKCEGDLFEECQGDRVQRTRNGINVTIIFSQEDMQLIDLIEL